MPRTLESITTSHHAACARRRAQRPVWDQQVQIKDVLADPALTFTQRRDAIAARLQASAWVRADDDSTIAALVAELELTDTDHYLAEVLDAIYDQGDLDRVWIA